MSRTNLDLLAEEVLTHLEMDETSLLSWGFLGGNFNASQRITDLLNNPPTQFISRLWEQLQGEGATPIHILDNLVTRKLLFVFGEKARSRYGETVRLMYLLKQRFAKDDWNTAPNLVSNTKILLKYRKYPKRNRNWQEVLESLRNRGIEESVVIDALYVLLGNGTVQLATFQMEALEHLLNSTRTSWDGATIVGAGTSSGKTKAFYLPAFAYLSKSISEDSLHWTRILALYPRTELLKDQLKEALSEAIKLNEHLQAMGSRTIRVGAYYGDTPYRAGDVEESQYYRWERTATGYICPFVICPICNANMVWLEEDQRRETTENNLGRYGDYEILHCTATGCHTEIGPDNIILTRKRMETTPPDILFTTTEMLNRKLFSLVDQHIFGLQTTKPPKFVLLDEVHIYSEVTGAHVAYLLRRWRNLVRQYSKGSTIHFIGLSATLTNPRPFFSNLVGLSESNTRCITPGEEDLTEEGLEYNIILRGDPISSTALLSTSVQTAMLLGRMLDPIGDSVVNSMSKGAWGSKIFGFTDKLDVINRWYHIEMDAEKNKTLSKFRDPNLVQNPRTLQQQINAGQVWKFAEIIDNKSLKNPMKIGITSSQNKGVDSKAKLVIATSTLEVGFNDNSVGAVIQHKAPRNLASFLQRKGRAGRSRGMRPWTVVVTSAYGRDRWVYENPEQIFDGVLQELNLPTRNSYVQHIQASFALMDWLSLQIYKRGIRNLNIYDLLSPKSQGRYLDQKKIVLEILMQVLTGNYQNLAKFIEEALKLTQLELDRVLWSPPRSIMLELVPALSEQIRTDWKQYVQNNQVYHDGNMFEDYPLAGYVPRNLFSNLEISDIRILVPKRTDNENMSLRQGLVEFAPGNVSKRFANVNYIGDAHWIPLPSGDVIDLHNNENIKVTVDMVVIGDEPLALCLPKQFVLLNLPKEVNDRSTGMLSWKVRIQANGEESGFATGGKIISLRAGSPLEAVIGQIKTFSSDNNQWVLCTRYATEVNSDLRFRNGKSAKKTFCFEHNGVQAALGYQTQIDALGLKYKLPDIRSITLNPDWDKILSDLRPQFYNYQLNNNHFLREQLSVFEIEWLARICLSAVVAIGISRQTDFQESVRIYRYNLKDTTVRALNDIFQTITVSATEDSELEEGKLQDRLIELIDSPQIIELFLQKLDILYTDLTVNQDFWEWNSERYISSVGAAFKDAIDGLLPDLNTEDLLTDVDDGVIWVLEPDSGGMGVISAIAVTIQSNPRKFEELFLKSISLCKRQNIAASLNTVIAGLQKGDFVSTFKEVRATDTLEEQKVVLNQLQKELYTSGITPTREFVVALVTKLLNSNSSSLTDELIWYLHDLWRSEETRLGCAIDSRIFAVACLKLGEISEKVDRVLKSVSHAEAINEKQRFALIESMLWLGCFDSCPDCLQIYNPYKTFASPARFILEHFIRPNHEFVSYNELEWVDKVLKALEKGRPVRVKVAYEEITTCRRDLLSLTLVPVEIGFELFYPFVDGVTNSGTVWYFNLIIREVLHA